jgi:hypothetical protein
MNVTFELPSALAGQRIQLKIQNQNKIQNVC